MLLQLNRLIEYGFYPQLSCNTHNMAIEQAIQYIVYEDLTNWLSNIPFMKLAIKRAIYNSIQDSTGLSPAYVAYGTLIKMLLDMLDGVLGSTSGAYEVYEKI